ncbi:MAG: HAD-IA family hydrolase [Nitrospinae bacterium]|nr:HAD-IA family hydrolase [Nitrospinota bacterium]MBI3815310.1 HAD-IA family hydrolase [Nitrospinota bacterium]
MEKNIDLIIFDLDGTLIDSKVDIADSVNFTLRELNLKEIPYELIYTYVGNGVEPLIRLALERSEGRAMETASLPTPTLKKGGNGGIEKALAIFRTYYWEHLLDNTVLYPNVIEVIKRLSGIKKAVVSNKSERFVKKILLGLAIDGYFEIALGGDSLKNKKPHPDMINSVTERLGISSSRTLIVGDSAVDIECGKRAGAYTCGVSYGYRERDELVSAGADWIIEDMGELVNLIMLQEPFFRFR